MYSDDGSFNLSGFFRGEIDFDPGTGTHSETASNVTATNPFVVKLDTNSNFHWVFTAGETAWSYPGDIQLDHQGNVLFTLNFRDSINLVPGNPAYKLTCAGNTDAVFIRISASGGILSSHHFAGNSLESPPQIICNNYGELFLGGRTTSSSIDLDFSPAVYTTGIDSSMNFIAKYTECAPIDTTVIVVGNILTTAQSGYNYQWVDCDNGNSPIPGATAQTFVPTANGNYAVQISGGSCYAISGCRNIIAVNANTPISETLTLLLAPNPADSRCKVICSSPISNIEIFSISGQKLNSFSINHGQYQVQMDVSGMGAGIYFVKVYSPEGVATQKLVIQ